MRQKRREVGGLAQYPKDRGKSKDLSKKSRNTRQKASCRILGIVNPAMLSMGAEIDQRIWATNRAWERALRKCGGTRGYPSGSNAHCSVAMCAEHDSRASLRFFSMTVTTFCLQRCLEKKLRALMLGTASWAGQDHTRTLSSRQVWERWRSAPPTYELCVQKLRWYQSIAREPARHAHLLCCW